MIAAHISELNDTWRKQAASATMDNTDVEKAFLDQAYTFLQNKAGPIMKAPYRIGFEIVFKNDDNSRMVGIFVFRVSKTMFYAPVFFINGSIKGTDLFYRCTEKKFVPLVAGWVNYLLSMSNQPEGQGVPIGDRSQYPNQMSLRQMAMPPGYSSMGSSFKFASASEMDITREDLVAAVEHMKEAMVNQRVYRDVITECLGHGGMAKMADAAEKNFDFANAMFVSLHEEDLAPSFDGSVKQATTETVLTLHRGVVGHPGVKQASADDLKRDYAFTDHRKDAEVNLAVYDVNPNHLSSYERPGVYQAWKADGSTQKLVIANQDEKNLLDDRGTQWSQVSSCYPGGNPVQTLVVVDLETKNSKEVCNTASNPLLANLVSEIQDDTSAKAAPESGHAYRLLLNGCLTRPFYVTDVSGADGGLKTVHACWHNPKDPSGKFTIKLNPEIDHFVSGENIVGKQGRFIEVSFKKPGESAEGCPVSDYLQYPSEVTLGNPKALEEFVRRHEYKAASVCFDDRSSNWITRVEGEKAQVHQSRAHAVATLMTKCAVRQNTAEELLEKASSERRTQEFFHVPLTKLATNLRMPPLPLYDQEMDEEQMALQEPHTTYSMLEADRQPPMDPPHRLGDHYRGEGNTMNGTGSLLETGSPMELFQASQEHNMPNLFEHGAVGSLVKTYDSIALLDRYIPKMEDALDVLGRTLFLFYWKPEDFSAAYGSDDLSSLENQLLSCFKSLGDLTLELLQKSRSAQMAHPGNS